MYWYLLFISLLVLFDTKLISPVNTLMCLFFYNGAVLLFSKSRLKESISFSALACVIYVFTSINPYLTSIKEGKHVLYPAMGEGSFNLISGQIPIDFKDNNRIGNFIGAVFCMTENDKEPIRFKIPGFVTWQEFSLFPSWADTRKAGFGPSFSLLLIVSGILFIMTMVFSDNKLRYVTLFISGALLITVLLNPANWWARMVPQLWLVPIVWLIATICYAPRPWGTMAKVVVLAALMVQGFYFSTYLYYQNTKARQIRKQLVELRDSDRKMAVYFGPCRMTSKRLDEYGVSYEIVKEREAIRGNNSIENSTSVFDYLDECELK